MSEKGFSVTPNVVDINRKTKLQDVYNSNFNREGKEAKKPIQFSEIDRRARKDTVSDLKLAIERSKAVTDPLTGLLNRRGWDELVKKQSARMNSLGRRLTIAIGDVDNLKTTNDTLGYEAGDNLLKKAAKGFKARWGGDEFGDIYDVTENEAAKIITEDIAPQLENDGVQMGIAVIELDDSSPQNESETYRIAHQVLKAAKRRAKETGRVVVMQPRNLPTLEILRSDAEEKEAA